MQRAQYTRYMCSNYLDMCVAQIKGYICMRVMEAFTKYPVNLPCGIIHFSILHSIDITRTSSRLCLWLSVLVHIGNGVPERFLVCEYAPAGKIPHDMSRRCRVVEALEAAVSSYMLRGLRYE